MAERHVARHSYAKDPALEPLAALRELQHRVVVVELLRMREVGTGELEEALHDLPYGRLVSHS